MRSALFSTIPFVLSLLVVATPWPAPVLGQETDSPAAATSAVEGDWALLDELRSMQEEIDRLDRLWRESEGQERALYGELLRERVAAYRARFGELVGALTEDSLPEGVDPERVRGLAEELLQRQADWLLEHVEPVARSLSERRSEMLAATGVERIWLEEQVREQSRGFSELEAALVENLEWRESLGMPTEELARTVDAQLRQRADLSRARILLLERQLADLSSRLRTAPQAERSELEARIANLEERLAIVQEALRSTIDSMRSRGLETELLQEVLIESRGELTQDVLDPRVAARLFSRGWQRIRTAVIEQGPRWLVGLLVFVAIIFAAWALSRWVRRILSHSFERSGVRTSQLSQQFLISTAAKLVLVFGVLFALSQVGIDLGPALAGLGIAGIAIGFALQDTLSNLASGVMILVYRPFDVGDIVEAAGVSGTVRDMNLVSTTILTFDNRTLIVPNNRIWGDTIQNVTAQQLRRVDLEFGVGYESDLDRVEQVLREVVEGHESILSEPEPIIRLQRMDDSALVFICRPWTERDNYWTVYWDLMRQVKRRFDEEGIGIPFPQRDVHLHLAEGSALDSRLEERVPPAKSREEQGPDGS